MRGAIGLATEGFFEGVEAGRIAVHPNRTIARLLAGNGTPGRRTRRRHPAPR